MKLHRSAVLATSLLLGASGALAQDSTERQLMYQLLQRMDQLEREVRQLRGEQEVLQYKLQQAEDRGQRRYADTNDRLSRLEGGAGTDRGLSATTSGQTQPGRSQSGTIIAPPGAETAPGARTMAPPGAQSAEQAAYEKAFELLREGSFAESVTAFDAFLNRYPNGELAPNAQYWMGEAHYVNRDFEQAKTAFETVLSRYPNSPKVPDAHLKLGFTLQELGQTAAARSILNEVVEEYPSSAVARLAERRLQEIGG